MNWPSIDPENFKVDVLPSVSDERGNLTILDIPFAVPFPVRRLFFVDGVPPNVVRGQHAHFKCNQYLVCQRGKIRVELTDGKQVLSPILSPGQAVFIRAGIFASETYIDGNSLLMVLCDRPYESEDYIHTLDEFLRLRLRGAVC